MFKLTIGYFLATSLWVCAIFFKLMGECGNAMHRLVRRQQVKTGAVPSHAVPNGTTAASAATASAVKVPDWVIAQGVVSNHAKALYQKPASLTAARVVTFDLKAHTGLPLGAAWIYLYPDERKARRVVKFSQVDVANVVCGVRKCRYYFADAAFDPTLGIQPVQDQFVEEIRKLLNRKQIDKAKEVTATRFVDAGKSVAPVDAPVTPMPAKVVEVPAAPPVKATVVATAMPETVKPIVVPTQPQTADKPRADRPVDRSVKGTVHSGTVVHAGKTTKEGREGKYETYCLTINDGEKEIPLTGVEISRQVRDLGVGLGDRVKVVDMGRQPYEMASGAKGWRNLYQVSVLERAT